MKLIIPALAVALTTAPVAAAAQDDPVVTREVAHFRSAIGRTSPDGAVIRRIEAEGHALVFRVTIPADYTFPVELVAEALSQGICADGDEPAFFREGRTLRVEMTPPQGQPRVATRDRCPERARPSPTS